MKKPVQHHIIDKQNIILNVTGNISDAELKTLQQEIVHLYKTKVGDMLDNLLSELIPADVHIKLDKLNIILPQIDLDDFRNSAKLTSGFERDFKKIAEKSIREEIIRVSRGKFEKSSQGLNVSKWSILENFLEHGHYPSWASKQNDSMEKIFEELIQKSPAKVAKLVTDLSRSNRSKIVDRLVFQFRGKYVDRLLSLLFQKNGREAMKLIENVRRRLGQRYQAMRGQKSVYRAIMSAAFDYVLERTVSGKKLKYNEKELSQYLLEAIQSKYRHVDETDISDDFSTVKNEFKSEHSDLDVLEYFLGNGSLPFWTNAESKESVQELFNRLTLKKLSALQRMIEKHRNDDVFIKRLVMQFSFDQLLALMEPMSSDSGRFLKDLIRELELSNFAVQNAKEAVIRLYINQRERFSKTDISLAVFESSAEYKGIALKDFLVGLYAQIQERSAIAYDLGRSELIRIIAEIQPDIEELAPSILKKRQNLSSESSNLKDQIALLTKLLRDKTLSPEQRKKLSADRKILQIGLSELIKEMQSLGVSDLDSISELHSQKIALENNLSDIEINSEDEKNLRKKINEIKTAVSKLQKRLLADLAKAEDDEKRQKLIVTLEKRLLLLGRERDRTEASIAELGDNLSKSGDKKTLTILKRRQELLRRTLSEIDKNIDTISRATESYKAIDRKDEIVETSENSKLDFLIFFLQYGSIPWWAENYKDSSIESIFKEFAEKDAEKLRQAFQRVGRNPVIWQRLVNQLNELVLEKVLLILFPNFAGFAISTAIMLQKIIEAKILSSLQAVSVHYFKWSRVVQTLFTMTSSLNPQNFIKTVVSELSKEFNISPTTLLEYIANLSDNNPGTRLSIFADIVRPVKNNAEILELEKDLLEMAFKKRLEDEGLAIPEPKKIDVLSDYILKGTYHELSFKSGYSSPEAMGRLMLELMIKQWSAVEKLLETAQKNTGSRRRISQELPDDIFWEIVLIIAPSTMPLVRKYIKDLGIALADERMSVAKEALLKYIHQLSDKPFAIRDFIDILLKDAAQITQRTRIALINEWKRKVYQAPSYSSTLVIALMQAEMKDIKNLSDTSEDQAEKEQLKDRLFSLQMEYQQMSQRLAYLLNRELAQTDGEFEIPENSEDFYQKIREIESEIEKLQSGMLENPKGEELLQQIMNQKQLAMLEGQLDVLKSREPLSIRQLELESGSITRELSEIEQQLLSLPEYKISKLPTAPIPDELETLAADLDESYLSLKEKVKKISEDERSEWIEFVAEMGWEDLLKSWSIDQEDNLLKELPTLSLFELSERWNSLEDKSSSLSKRIMGRMKVLITRTLQQLRREHKLLSEEIENAENTEKCEGLKKDLLQKELAQNDLINIFFSVTIDNNLRQSLLRIRNNIRQNFHRLRAQADARKAGIVADTKEKFSQKITTLKERRESLIKLKKESIEQLKNTDKTKDSRVKPEKENKKKKPDKPVEEPLFIRNAGLVILHPYYGRLFSTLNLTEKNKFVSQDAQIRAVHLLQYIATGKTEHPENELVLNKILCGLPLSTPVPMDVGLSDDELKVASGLLTGAIANWTKMKTMSPDSLRGTFLLREGTIKEEADRWKLKAEKGSFDILLKTLPWAFNFVRYGWLPKFIMVEWPLPG